MSFAKELDEHKGEKDKRKRDRQIESWCMQYTYD